MRHSSLAGMALLLLAAIVLCLPGASWGQGDKGGKGKTVPKVGLRWEYTIREGTKKVEEGVFRAFDGKLFHGKNQIGTYRENQTLNQATMEIKQGKLKGTTERRRMANDPP